MNPDKGLKGIDNGEQFNLNFTFTCSHFGNSNIERSFVLRIGTLLSEVANFVLNICFSNSILFYISSLSLRPESRKCLLNHVKNF